MLLGSAFKNKGIQPLLDAVVDYLPSPLDVPPVHGLDPRTDHELSRRPALDEPFAALAFKVMSDPYVGRLTYIRVYSGQVKAGDRVLNTATGRTERISRIRMHANHREEREEIGAGEIAALVGLKNTSTGETLAVETAPIRLESMDFPEPVISVAIEPKTKGDQDKLCRACSGCRTRIRPSACAPTRRRARRSSQGWASSTSRSSSTASCASSASTRTSAARRSRTARRSRSRSRRSRAASSARPAAAASTGTSTSTWSRPSRARLRVPRPDHRGNIPKEYIPPVDLGIQEAMESGILAGYPVVDVRVSLVDGSYHDVDSSEMAFKVAGSMAFKAAMQRQARAARAGDGRRGRDARGVPRRRGRPEHAAATSKASSRAATRR